MASPDSSAVTAIRDWGELSSLLSRPSKLVVMAFMAPWSEPWKVMKPIFESIASKHRTAAYFCTLNVDNFYFKYLGRHLRVEALPTFLLVRDRRVKDRVVGVKEENELDSRIRNLIIPQDTAAASTSAPS